MNIWKISIKNIKSKPLYTFLSIAMLSLSIALLLGIQQIKTSFQHQMENNLGDINVVVGAKGSPLQLVLSSVLHLDNPTGNIPYDAVKKMKRNPLIQKTVPISYGDNYKGYRIVGTTDEFLSLYEAELKEGRPVEKTFEVVIGHAIAERLQLKLGDTFKSSHGLIENELDVHDTLFTIVGILKPTQKVVDRLIITNLRSIWDVHDHDHGAHGHEDEHNHESEDHEHDHNEAHHHETQEADDAYFQNKEVTSILISFRSPAGVLTFPRGINENTNMQAALPKYELDRLYQFTGIGFNTISWIAYIILIISGLTIFISLYKMVKERAFDLALLRTYGASNFQLIKMVAYEGFTVVLSALLFGFLITKSGLYALFQMIENSAQQNILIELPLHEYLQITGLVFLMIVLSITFAIYPIIKMNISTILSNEK